MMTAFGTIADMVPIALELATGLERTSPLAGVAVRGLIGRHPVNAAVSAYVCLWL